MKFILVFVGLFFLVQCQPNIDEELAENPPDNVFETRLDTKEDKEVPIEDNANQEDKQITAQLFRPTTCVKCICSKPNNYGYSHHALCYRCNNRRKCWRVCHGCYCYGHRYGVFDTRFGFCRRCT